MRIQVLIVLAAARCGLGPAAARATPLYRVIDLGTLGGSGSVGTAVNSSGQVVGYSETAPGQSRAFLYSDGRMLDLGTLGGTNSGAYDINARGQVVGSSRLSGGASHGFLYTEGSMIDLGTLGGDRSSAASINDLGQMTGWSSIRSGGARNEVFLYDNGVMSSLGTFGQDNITLGASINNKGEITGQSTFDYEHDSANSIFIYSNGVMRDIGGSGLQNAYAINDRGEVTGWTEAFDDHAFLYRDGTMIDLGTLPGGVDSAGYNLNNLGEVVGQSDVPLGGPHAFLYAAGVMHDLNDLIDPASGWTLKEARCISDNGWITGGGTNAAGQNHAYVLVPVPEPSDVLAGAALLPLLARRRRRRLREAGSIPRRDPVGAVPPLASA